MASLHTRIANKLAIKLGGHAKYLDAPVPALITSNEPPTDDDLIAVKRAIAIAKSRLKEAQTLASPGFNYHSQPLIEFIRSHEAVFSPLRRLPTELVEEIFLHYFEVHEDPAHNLPPYPLSHVCQRWRRAALAMPALWRHLPPIQGAKTWNKQEIAQRRSFIETLLQRSSNAGITFFLSKTSGSDVDDSLLPLLFQHSERWERISLVVSEDVCAHFSRVRGRMSSLTSLKLDIQRTGNLHVDMFEDVPNLRDVSLAAHGIVHGIVNLPWSQLTNFTESNIDFRHLAHVLTTSSNLEQLNFSIEENDANDVTFPDLSQTIIHQHLTSVTLQSINSHPELSLVTLFEKLTLPALQDLTVRYFPFGSITNDLVTMIKRSTCDLQRLVIHFRPFCVDMKAILELTPNLLHLDTNQITYPLVNDLCKRGAGAGWSLVPRLQSLSIRLMSSNSPLEDITILADGRCNPFYGGSGPQESQCRPLQSFVIISPLQQDYASAFGIKMGTPAWKDKLVELRRGLDEQLQEIRNAKSDTQPSRKERIARLSQKIDESLSILEDLSTQEDTAPYLYYDRLDDTLWQLLFSTQELPFHQKVKFNERLESLVCQWASILDRSSWIEWIWEKPGHLKYVPEADDRKSAQFNFKQVLLDRLPVTKDQYSWPYT